MSARDWEFRHVVGIVNMTTGELAPVDIEIHRNDVPWLVELWQPFFALDWELRRAEGLTAWHPGEIHPTIRELREMMRP